MRVELHEKSKTQKPSGSDYENLHEVLSEKDIERWVSVKDKGTQFLPSAFYYTESSDRAAVAAAVRSAASTVGYPFSFVVVEAKGATVYNLEACS